MWLFLAKTMRVVRSSRCYFSFLCEYLQYIRTGGRGECSDSPFQLAQMRFDIRLFDSQRRVDGEQHINGSLVKRLRLSCLRITGTKYISNSGYRSGHRIRTHAPKGAGASGKPLLRP